MELPLEYCTCSQVSKCWHSTAVRNECLCVAMRASTRMGITNSDKIFGHTDSIGEKSYTFLIDHQSKLVCLSCFLSPIFNANSIPLIFSIHPFCFFNFGLAESRNILSRTTFASFAKFTIRSVRHSSLTILTLSPCRHRCLYVPHFLVFNSSPYLCFSPAFDVE